VCAPAFRAVLYFYSVPLLFALRAKNGVDVFREQPKKYSARLRIVFYVKNALSNLQTLWQVLRLSRAGVGLSFLFHPASVRAVTNDSKSTKLICEQHSPRFLPKNNISPEL